MQDELSFAARKNVVNDAGKDGLIVRGTTRIVKKRSEAWAVSSVKIGVAASSDRRVQMGYNKVASGLGKLKRTDSCPTDTPRSAQSVEARCAACVC
jgi:hypothetical protein